MIIHFANMAVPQKTDLTILFTKITLKEESVVNTATQHSLYTSAFFLALQILCACPKKKKNNYSKVEFHIPRGLFESSALISGNNWAEN